MTQLYGTLPSQVPTNADLGTMAFQDANAAKVVNITATGSLIGTVTPTSSTFALLPAASIMTGQVYLVSDVGTHGSYWVSDGTVWQLVGGVTDLYQNGIPMCIPPSGTIAVTTGALTLGTALDNTYPNIYMWFPAGAWTGSVAGMYYVSMSSTTAGTVYSNSYAGGVATIPTTPTLVTAGAGAYTQTINVATTLLSYTLPANCMSSSGKLNASYVFSAASTAGAKSFSPWSQFVSTPTSLFGTSTGISGMGTTVLVNLATNKQVTPNALGSGTGYQLLQTAVDTTAALLLTPKAQLAVATDWIVLHSMQYQLNR